jgi:hypothetical protein
MGEANMNILSTCVKRASGVWLAFCLVAQFVPANAAPSIVQGHYEEVIGIVCNQTPNCWAYFSAVPAGELLVVQSASCTIGVINAPASPGLTQVYLSSSTTQGAKAVDLGQFYMPPTSVMSTTAGKSGLQIQKYQASATGISKTFQAAEVPVIYVGVAESVATIEITCSIIGTVTP